VCTQPKQEPDTSTPPRPPDIRPGAEPAPHAIGRAGERDCPSTGSSHSDKHDRINSAYPKGAFNSPVSALPEPDRTTADSRDGPRPRGGGGTPELFEISPPFLRKCPPLANVTTHPPPPLPPRFPVNSRPISGDPVGPNSSLFGPLGKT